jgi:hypothetical protein
MIIGEGAVWCCWDVIMLSCDGGSEKEWPSFTGLGEKEVFFLVLYIAVYNNAPRLRFLRGSCVDVFLGIFVSIFGFTEV